MREVCAIILTLSYSNNVSLEHIKLAFGDQVKAPDDHAPADGGSQSKTSSLPNKASRTRASGKVSKQDADEDAGEGSEDADEDVVSGDDSDSDNGDDQSDIHPKDRAEFIMRRFRRMLSTSRS